MALYRYQAVSVSLWRGKPKRFNNTFYRTDPSSVAALKTSLNATGFKADGDALGACSGGIASITVYDAAGGAPLSKTTYFDWTAPGTWIPYSGEGWAGVPSGTPVDASGESALILWAPLPGLSATGKPMSVRKYLHAVPSRSAAAYSDPDIDPAVVTTLKNQWALSFMFSPAGAQGTAINIEPYYGNHQRVRGRRRTTAQVVGQSFSAGVVLGTTTPGSGGLPFQNQ